MSGSVQAYANMVVSDFRNEANVTPDQGTIDAWVNALAHGATEGELRYDLATSQAAAGCIQDLYNGIMGRPAQGWEMASVENWMASGASLQQVRSALADSGEAAGRVAAMFQAATGAAPTAAWVQTIQGNLATVWSLGDVGNWLAGVGSQIQGLYNGIVGRPAQGWEVASVEEWVASGASLQQVRGALAGSGEAAGRVAAMFQAATGVAPTAAWVQTIQGNLATTWALSDLSGWLANVGGAVKGLYADVLGRVADPGGLAHCLELYASGTSLAQIRADLGASAEATNAIMADYRSELGRDANANEMNYFEAQLQGGGATSASLRIGLASCAEAQADLGAIFQQVLGRGTNAGDLAWTENSLAAGASMADVRGAVAHSGSAQADINALYGAVLGRGADAGGLATYENALAAGGTLASVRASLAGSGEAAGDVAAKFAAATGGVAPDAGWVQAIEANLATVWGQGDLDGWLSGVGAAVKQMYLDVLGRPADPAGLAANLELAARSSLAQVRVSLANSGEAAGDVAAKFTAATGVAPTLAWVQTIQNNLATVWGQGDVSAWLSNVGSDINALYEDVLGRAADPAGLASYLELFASGATLAQIRVDLAQSAEGAGVVRQFYQVTFGRPPSADELVGMQYALGATIPDNATFGYFNAANQPLALTAASNLLAQLPVAVTLCGGGTPQLGLPGGVTQDFGNAAQLAACVLGLTLRQGQASAGSLSAYQLTVDWLDRIDQPMLQVASHWLAVAQYDHSIGNEGQATLAATAYQLALKLAALPPGARGGPDYGMASSVMMDGHHTTVIVYADTSGPAGHVVFHDKPNDVIPGIIEQVVTVVVDVLAVVFPYAFAPVAAVLNAAEAGQSFNDGNVLGGVLHLASAAGFGVGAAGYAKLGEEVLAVTAAVGGASTIVQSVENGDALGAVAGALVIAAAAASQGFEGIPGGKEVANFGDVSIGGTPLHLSIDLTAALSAAAAAGGVADALQHGDVTSALITSLGPLLSAVASSYQSITAQEAAADAKVNVVGEVAKFSSVNTNLDKNYVVLVGTFPVDTNLDVTLIASADDPQQLKQAAAAARAGGLRTPQELRIFHDAITGEGITSFSVLVSIAKAIKQNGGV